MYGDEGLVSWTEAEEKKLRGEMIDFVSGKIRAAKHLSALDVMFEAYLGVIWHAADVSPKVYKDTLERIGDMNSGCLEALNEQLERAKKELTEEGIEIEDEWKD